MAAAALVRYERDEHFRQAVDQHRSEIEDVYRQLTDVRESAAHLSREELDELVRFIAETQLDF